MSVVCVFARLPWGRLPPCFLHFFRPPVSSFSLYHPLYHPPPHLLRSSYFPIFAFFLHLFVFIPFRGLTAVPQVVPLVFYHAGWFSFIFATVPTTNPHHIILSTFRTINLVIIPSVFIPSHSVSSINSTPSTSPCNIYPFPLPLLASYKRNRNRTNMIICSPHMRHHDYRLFHHCCPAVFPRFRLGLALPFVVCFCTSLRGHVSNGLDLFFLSFCFPLCFSSLRFAHPPPAPPYRYSFDFLCLGLCSFARSLPLSLLSSYLSRACFSCLPRIYNADVSRP